MDDWEKFNETFLPLKFTFLSMKDFFSHLNMEDITEHKIRV